jgi:HEAT repeat protein
VDFDEASRNVELLAPACWPAFTALAESADPRSVHVLVRQLESRDWTRRRAAAEALGKNPGGANVATKLRATLADPKPYVVQAAAGAVAAIRDRESRPALLALLIDRDESTRMAALWALQELWESTDVDRVLRIADEDESVDVRKAANWLLKRHAAPEMWRSLFEVWSRSQVPRERAWAAELAAAFGGPSARDLLEPFLSDQDGHVRKYARRLSGHVTFADAD